MISGVRVQVNTTGISRLTKLRSAHLTFFILASSKATTALMKIHPVTFLLPLAILLAQCASASFLRGSSIFLDRRYLHFDSNEKTSSDGGQGANGKESAEANNSDSKNLHCSSLSCCCCPNVPASNKISYWHSSNSIPSMGGPPPVMGPTSFPTGVLNPFPISFFR